MGPDLDGLFCEEVNHSIMIWYVGTWRVSRELEDHVSYRGLVKLGGGYSLEEKGPFAAP